MALNPQAVAVRVGPKQVSWDERDVMLYALAVGAGQVDPTAELDLTTENSKGIELQVLPTFALVIALNAGLRPDLGDIDRSKVVHAFQGLELLGPLPTSGSVSVSSRVTGIEDKTSGALVTTATDAVDSASGNVLFRTVTGIFIRGAGGFDQNRVHRPKAEKVQSPAPDLSLVFATRPDQALLYRLCGDRNPLHSDPVVALAAGFSQPILHGLCTYGVTARLLLQQASVGTPRSLRRISARFTKPVRPGSSLTVMGWLAEGSISFRTVDESGAIVLDDGVLEFS